MRILVAGDRAGERQRLSSSLRSDERTVIDATLENAESEIRRQLPDVLLAMLPASGGPDLLRAFITADPVGSMYVIAVTSEAHHARIVSSALAAGSHDILCAPFTDHELRARVDVRRRLQQWISSRARVAGVAKPTSSNLGDLRSWQFLGHLVADDFETMFGRSLHVEQRWPTFPTTSQRAAISMTLPAEQLELCLSVVADAAARRWLGANLLEDPAASPESVSDILRELANVAGGALKRAIQVEGPTLTTGIPVDGSAVPSNGNGAHCWTMELDEGVTLALISEVYPRTKRRVPARRLVEGMVVVSDVRTPAGVLLLPSGTRLTMTTAQRLSHLLDSALIEVAS